MISMPGGCQGNRVAQRFTAQALAELVDGSVHGVPELEIEGTCSIDAKRAEAESRMSFFLEKKSIEVLAACEASLVAIAELPDDWATHPAYKGRSYIVCSNPELAHALIKRCYHPLPRATEHAIHPTALIDETAVIESPVHIGPHVVVDARSRIAAGSILGPGTVIGPDCVVGADCYLHANVTLEWATTLGARVEIHPGAVLGTDGFGYARDRGKFLKVPQTGGVTVGDDAEIGANSCVDRGANVDTVLGRGVKIDNLVQVGHNSVVGDDTGIAALVGIAGSTTIGSRCMVGGQTGFSGHLAVHDDVIFGARTGVTADIEKPGYYLGYPARPAREQFRIWSGLGKLSELSRRLRRLERAQEDASSPSDSAESPGKSD